MTFKARVRSNVSLGSLVQLVKHPHAMTRLPGYIAQLRRYRELEKGHVGQLSRLRLYPCLDDNQSNQTVGFYFYQDCWAARQVFRERPAYFVDVGSTVLLAGILSQFVPCISVDIRPIDAKLECFSSKAGSVLQLPFEDDEVPCVTTMCVLEHIGLGRYGDPLDPLGTMKAVQEIARVLKPGGIVVYSVPVGQAMTEFNANRRYTLEQAAGFFAGWEMVDSCILTPTPVPSLSERELAAISDPTACFCARKPR